MDAEQLIGSLVRGAFSSRRKRGDRTLRFLTGGRGSFLNASSLLTVAGLAWGLMESAGPKTTVPVGGGRSAAPEVPRPPLPPLPASAAPAEAAVPAIPADLLSVLRLTISAARADGDFSAAETDMILAHARAAGADQIVEAELRRTVPLSEIVAGVPGTAQKQDLYTLAFAVVRADQGVSGAERIYLAQLALALDLDSATTQRLEREAVEKISQV